MRTKRKASIIVQKEGVPFRSGNVLKPVSGFDWEELEAHPAGTEFDLTPRTKRSNRQNRLYWQALSRIVAATGRWATKEHLHDALLRDLGYVSVSEELLDGRQYLIRDSAAFDAMSHADFGVYFEKAIARLAEATGVDPLDFMDARAA